MKQLIENKNEHQDKSYADNTPPYLCTNTLDIPDAFATVER